MTDREEEIPELMHLEHRVDDEGEEWETGSELFSQEESSVKLVIREEMHSLRVALRDEIKESVGRFSKEVAERKKNRHIEILSRVKTQVHEDTKVLKRIIQVGK